MIYMIAIEGNTYPFKEKLRDMGFKWDSLSKKWVNDEITKEMIEKIKKEFLGNFDVTIHFFTDAKYTDKYQNIIEHGER